MVLALTVYTLKVANGMAWHGNVLAKGCFRGGNTCTYFDGHSFSTLKFSCFY